MTTSPRFVNSRVLSWLRFLLGIGILVWVFARLPMEEFREVLAASVSFWHWWVAGILMTLLGLLAAAVRWHGLLAAQGVTLPFHRVFRIFFIGQFFNSFLPGSCGGDVARAYYVFKETTLRRTEAVSTVLVDRGIGLLTIVLFCCVMIAWRLPTLLAYPWAKAAGLVMLALLFAALIGGILFFRRHIFENGTIFQRLEKETRLGPIVRRMYNAFYVYRDQPRALGWAVLFSLGNLAGLTLACYAFGQSLSLDVSVVDYFTLFPMITVLSAIPLTPGALGVREGLFAELFTMTGARAVQTVPLSLMVYGGGLFWSLFGGLIFISYSSSYGVSWREEWSRLSEEHERELKDESASDTP